MRTDGEEAQRPVRTPAIPKTLGPVVVEITPTIPTVVPANDQAQTAIDSLNPTIGIMNVVRAVIVEAGEEVSTPAPPCTVHDADIAIAAQFDTMLEEPNAQVEELEATVEVVTDEEEQLKLEK